MLKIARDSTSQEQLNTHALNDFSSGAEFRRTFKRTVNFMTVLILGAAFLCPRAVAKDPDLPSFAFKRVDFRNSKGPRHDGPKDVPPKGYTEGMKQSFIAMLQRLKDKRDVYAQAITSPSDNGNPKDVLQVYNNELTALGLKINSSQTSRLVAIYTVLYELGVRESDGLYYQGVDIGPNKPEAERKRLLSEDPKVSAAVGAETEAGLFQASWNFTYRNKIAADLCEDFFSGKRKDGMLEIFSQGITPPTPKKQRSYGSKEGLAFQKAIKANPNFAVEFSALTLRFPGVNNYYFTRYRAMELKPEVAAWFQSLVP